MDSIFCKHKLLKCLFIWLIIILNKEGFKNIVMKKVLLTGATGLIGKYAIKPLLDLGFDVFAVSTSSKSSQYGENWIQADLLKIDEIQKIFKDIKPQYLLHFAWDTTPGSYLESNLNFDWVQSSIEMLKQFKLNGGKRSIFAGTCFEYKFIDEPLKEDGILEPVSTYAKCKKSLNEIASLYCEKNDISFGWGRIFYVYGEDEQEKRLVPHVINSLLNNKEVEIWVGDLIKDYMFAGNIAEAFVKFLDSDIRGNVNISSGQKLTVKELVSLIASKLGKETLVRFENKPTSEPKMIFGDNTRLLNEVKYNPNYTLDESLDIVISSIKELQSI